MTTDKLTDETLHRLLAELGFGYGLSNETSRSVLTELLRLRAGLNRAKELRDGWAENYDIEVFAADEILKGFEP